MTCCASWATIVTSLSVISIATVSIKTRSWWESAGPGESCPATLPLGALGLTRCRCRDSGATVKRVGNSAYPRIISNLGGLSDDAEGLVAINMIRFMNHYARNIRERKYIIDYFRGDAYTPARFRTVAGGDLVEAGPQCDAFRTTGGRGGFMGTAAHVGLMYDFFGVGVANTLGYAHANSGDTMASVMIGGLRTVQNGDFELFAGDQIQFYWTFEKDDFMPDGRRKPYLDIWDGDVPQNVDPRTTENFRAAKRDADGRETWERKPDAQIRQTYFDLSYGQRGNKEKIVAKIKPYFADDENPRIFDWYRVFAVAIASARPNEACDIKISRQSM